MRKLILLLLFLLVFVSFTYAASCTVTYIDEDTYIGYGGTQYDVDLANCKADVNSFLVSESGWLSTGDNCYTSQSSTDVWACDLSTLNGGPLCQVGGGPNKGIVSSAVYNANGDCSTEYVCCWDDANNECKTLNGIAQGDHYVCPNGEYEFGEGDCSRYSNKCSDLVCCSKYTDDSGDPIGPFSWVPRDYCSNKIGTVDGSKTTEEDCTVSNYPSCPPGCTQFDVYDFPQGKCVYDGKVLQIDNSVSYYYCDKNGKVYNTDDYSDPGQTCNDECNQQAECDDTHTAGESCSDNPSTNPYCSGIYVCNNGEWECIDDMADSNCQGLTCDGSLEPTCQDVGTCPYKPKCDETTNFQWVCVPDMTNENCQSNGNQKECNDGVDNDNDGYIDYPYDPDCTSQYDDSETSECNDGIDNDGDGLIDYSQDPGCDDSSDNKEADCNDGKQNGDETGVDCGGSCGECSACYYNGNEISEGSCVTDVVSDAGVGLKCISQNGQFMLVPDGSCISCGDGEVFDPSTGYCVSSPEICYNYDNNGDPIDDDGDGLANCEDPDCMGKLCKSFDANSPAYDDSIILVDYLAQSSQDKNGCDWQKDSNNDIYCCGNAQSSRNDGVYDFCGPPQGCLSHEITMDPISPNYNNLEYGVSWHATCVDDFDSFEVLHCSDSVSRDSFDSNSIPECGSFSVESTFNRNWITDHSQNNNPFSVTYDFSPNRNSDGDVKYKCYKIVGKYGGNEVESDVKCIPMPDQYCLDNSNVPLCTEGKDQVSEGYLVDSLTCKDYVLSDRKPVCTLDSDVCAGSFDNCYCKVNSNNKAICVSRGSCSFCNSVLDMYGVYDYGYTYVDESFDDCKDTSYCQYQEKPDGAGYFDDCSKIRTMGCYGYTTREGCIGYDDEGDGTKYNSNYDSYDDGIDNNYADGSDSHPNTINNKCLNRNCKWIDINPELGKGVCVEVENEICDLCAMSGNPYANQQNPYYKLVSKGHNNKLKGTNYEVKLTGSNYASDSNYKNVENWLNIKNVVFGQCTVDLCNRFGSSCHSADYDNDGILSGKVKTNNYYVNEFCLNTKRFLCEDYNNIDDSIEKEKCIGSGEGFKIDPETNYVLSYSDDEVGIGACIYNVNNCVTDRDGDGSADRGISFDFTPPYVKISDNMASPSQVTLNIDYNDVIVSGDKISNCIEGRDYCSGINKIYYSIVSIDESDKLCYDYPRAESCILNGGVWELNGYKSVCHYSSECQEDAKRRLFCYADDKENDHISNVDNHDKYFDSLLSLPPSDCWRKPNKEIVLNDITDGKYSLHKNYAGGRYFVYYYGVDKAITDENGNVIGGNLEPVKSAQIYVDTVAPKIELNDCYDNNGDVCNSGCKSSDGLQCNDGTREYDTDWGLHPVGYTVDEGEIIDNNPPRSGFTIFFHTDEEAACGEKDGKHFSYVDDENKRLTQIYPSDSTVFSNIFVAEYPSSNPQANGLLDGDHIVHLTCWDKANNVNTETFNVRINADKRVKEWFPSRVIEGFQKTDNENTYYIPFIIHSLTAMDSCEIEVTDDGGNSIVNLEYKDFDGDGNSGDMIDYPDGVEHYYYQAVDFSPGAIGRDPNGHYTYKITCKKAGEPDVVKVVHFTIDDMPPLTVPMVAGSTISTYDFSKWRNEHGGIELNCQKQVENGFRCNKVGYCISPLGCDESSMDFTDGKTAGVPIISAPRKLCFQSQTEEVDVDYGMDGGVLDALFSEMGLVKKVKFGGKKSELKCVDVKVDRTIPKVRGNMKLNTNLQYADIMVFGTNVFYPEFYFDDYYYDNQEKGIYNFFNNLNLDNNLHIDGSGTRPDTAYPFKYANFSINFELGDVDYFSFVFGYTGDVYYDVKIFNPTNQYGGTLSIEKNDKVENSYSSSTLVSKPFKRDLNDKHINMTLIIYDNNTVEVNLTNAENKIDLKWNINSYSGGLIGYMGSPSGVSNFDIRAKRHIDEGDTINYESYSLLLSQIDENNNLDTLYQAVGDNEGKVTDWEPKDPKLVLSANVPELYEVEVTDKTGDNKYTGYFKLLYDAKPPIVENAYAKNFMQFRGNGLREIPEAPIRTEDNDGVLSGAISIENQGTATLGIVVDDIQYGSGRNSLLGKVSGATLSLYMADEDGDGYKVGNPVLDSEGNPIEYDMDLVDSTNKIYSFEKEVDVSSLPLGVYVARFNVVDAFGNEGSYDYLISIEDNMPAETTAHIYSDSDMTDEVDVLHYKRYYIKIDSDEDIKINEAKLVTQLAKGNPSLDITLSNGGELSKEHYGYFDVRNNDFKGNRGYGRIEIDGEDIGGNKVGNVKILWNEDGNEEQHNDIYIDALGPERPYFEPGFFTGERNRMLYEDVYDFLYRARDENGDVINKFITSRDKLYLTGFARKSTSFVLHNKVVENGEEQDKTIELTPVDNPPIEIDGSYVSESIDHVDNVDGKGVVFLRNVLPTEFVDRINNGEEIYLGVGMEDLGKWLPETTYGDFGKLYKVVSYEDLGGYGKITLDREFDELFDFKAYRNVKVYFYEKEYPPYWFGAEVELSPGENRINGVAVDDVNEFSMNANDINDYVIYYDTNPPRIGMTIPADGWTISTMFKEFVVRVFDSMPSSPVSDVNFKITHDGETYYDGPSTLYNGQYAVQVDNPGMDAEYEIKLTTRDINKYNGISQNSELPEGDYDISVDVKMADGSSVSKSWKFKVVDAGLNNPLLTLVGPNGDINYDYDLFVYKKDGDDYDFSNDDFKYFVNTKEISDAKIKMLADENMKAEKINLIIRQGGHEIFNQENDNPEDNFADFDISGIDFEEGDYVFQVVVKYEGETSNGNEILFSYPIYVVVDLTPPEVKDLDFIPYSKSPADDFSITLSHRDVDLSRAYIGLKGDGYDELFTDSEGNNYKMLGNGRQVVDGLSIPELDEGSYSLYVDVYDRAGNEAKLDSTLTIDNTAPKFDYEVEPLRETDKVVEKDNMYYSNRNRVNVKFTISPDTVDDVGRSVFCYQVNVEGDDDCRWYNVEENEFTVPVNLEGSNEQNVFNNVTFYIMDFAGNKYNTSVIFYVDMVRPYVVDNAFSGNLTNNTFINFTMSEEVDITDVHVNGVSLDGQRVEFDLDPVTSDNVHWKFVAQEPMVNGSYILSFRAVDFVGNEQAFNKIYAFNYRFTSFLDKSPPRINITFFEDEDMTEKVDELHYRRYYVLLEAQELFKIESNEDNNGIYLTVQGQEKKPVEIELAENNEFSDSFRGTFVFPEEYKKYYGPVYITIKAVDKAGNIADTLKVKDTEGNAILLDARGPSQPYFEPGFFSSDGGVFKYYDVYDFMYRQKDQKGNPMNKFITSKSSLYFTGFAPYGETFTMMLNDNEKTYTVSDTNKVAIDKTKVISAYNEDGKGHVVVSGHLNAGEDLVGKYLEFIGGKWIPNTKEGMFGKLYRIENVEETEDTLIVLSSEIDMKFGENAYKGVGISIYDGETPPYWFGIQGDPLKEGDNYLTGTVNDGKNLFNVDIPHKYDIYYDNVVPKLTMTYPQEGWTISTQFSEFRARFIDEKPTSPVVWANFTISVDGNVIYDGVSQITELEDYPNGKEYEMVLPVGKIDSSYRKNPLPEGVYVVNVRVRTADGNVLSSSWSFKAVDGSVSEPLIRFRDANGYIDTQYDMNIYEGNLYHPSYNNVNFSNDDYIYFSPTNKLSSLEIDLLVKDENINLDSMTLDIKGNNVDATLEPTLEGKHASFDLSSLNFEEGVYNLVVQWKFRDEEYVFGRPFRLIVDMTPPQVENLENTKNVKPDSDMLDLRFRLREYATSKSYVGLRNPEVNYEYVFADGVDYSKVSNGNNVFDDLHVPGINDGKYELFVKVYDQAGNLNETTSWLYVDSKAPRFTYSILPGSNGQLIVNDGTKYITNGKYIYLNATLENDDDIGRSYICYLNDQTPEKKCKPLLFDKPNGILKINLFSQRGSTIENNIKLVFFDEAGNSRNETFKIVVDQEPPNIYGEINGTLSQNTYINFGITEPCVVSEAMVKGTGGAYNLRVVKNDGKDVSLALDEPMENGTYELSFVLTDPMNNQMAVKGYVFNYTYTSFIDKSPPILKITFYSDEAMSRTVDRLHYNRYYVKVDANEEVVIPSNETDYGLYLISDGLPDIPIELSGNNNYGLSFNGVFIVPKEYEGKVVPLKVVAKAYDRAGNEGNYITISDTMSDTIVLDAQGPSVPYFEPGFFTTEQNAYLYYRIYSDIMDRSVDVDGVAINQFVTSRQNLYISGFAPYADSVMVSMNNDEREINVHNANGTLIEGSKVILASNSEGNGVVTMGGNLGINLTGKYIEFRDRRKWLPKAKYGDFGKLYRVVDYKETENTMLYLDEPIDEKYGLDTYKNMQIVYYDSDMPPYLFGTSVGPFKHGENYLYAVSRDKNNLITRQTPHTYVIFYDDTAPEFHYEYPHGGWTMSNRFDEFKVVFEDYSPVSPVVEANYTILVDGTLVYDGPAKVNKLNDYPNGREYEMVLPSNVVANPLPAGSYTVTAYVKTAEGNSMKHTWSFTAVDASMSIPLVRLLKQGGFVDTSYDLHIYEPQQYEEEINGPVDFSGDDFVYFSKDDVIGLDVNYIGSLDVESVTLDIDPEKGDRIEGLEPSRINGNHVVFDLSPLSEGRYKFTLRTRYKDETFQYVSQFLAIVDKEKPEISYIDATKDVRPNTNTLDLMFNLRDYAFSRALAGIRSPEIGYNHVFESSDGINYSMISVGKNYFDNLHVPTIDNGKYEVYVKVYDQAGNENEGSTLITVDRNPPMINYTVIGENLIFDGNHYLTNMNRVVLNVSVDKFDEGRSHVCVENNQYPDRKCREFDLSNKYTLVPLQLYSKRDYTIDNKLTLRYYDDAGNENNKTFDVVVDMEAPGVYGNFTGNLVNNTFINFELTEPADVSAMVQSRSGGRELKVIKKDNTHVSLALEEPMANDTYRLSLELTDGLGNKQVLRNVYEFSYVYYDLMDKSPPLIKMSFYRDESLSAPLSVINYNRYYVGITSNEPAKIVNMTLFADNLPSVNVDIENNNVFSENFRGTFVMPEDYIGYVGPLYVKAVYLDEAGNYGTYVEIAETGKNAILFDASGVSTPYFEPGFFTNEGNSFLYYSLYKDYLYRVVDDAGIARNKYLTTKETLPITGFAERASDVDVYLNDNVNHLTVQDNKPVEISDVRVLQASNVGGHGVVLLNGHLNADVNGMYLEFRDNRKWLPYAKYGHFGELYHIENVEETSTTRIELDKEIDDTYGLESYKNMRVKIYPNSNAPYLFRFDAGSFKQGDNVLYAEARDKVNDFTKGTPHKYIIYYDNKPLEVRSVYPKEGWSLSNLFDEVRVVFVDYKPTSPVLYANLTIEGNGIHVAREMHVSEDGNYPNAVQYVARLNRREISDSLPPGEYHASVRIRTVDGSSVEKSWQFNLVDGNYAVPKLELYSNEKIDTSYDLYIYKGDDFTTDDFVYFSNTNDLRRAEFTLVNATSIDSARLIVANEANSVELSGNVEGNRAEFDLSSVSFAEGTYDFTLRVVIGGHEYAYVLKVVVDMTAPHVNNIDNTKTVLPPGYLDLSFDLDEEYVSRGIISYGNGNRFTSDYDYGQLTNGRNYFDDLKVEDIPDGTYNLEISVYDQAGNRGVGSSSFSIDTHAPEFSYHVDALQLGDKYYTNENSVRVTLNLNNDNDVGSKVCYVNDQFPSMSCKSTEKGFEENHLEYDIRLYGHNDQTIDNKITFFVMDEAGNIGNETVHIVSDREAPGVVGLVEGNLSYHNPLRLNMSEWANITNVVVKSEEGQYELSAVSPDNVHYEFNLKDLVPNGVYSLSFTATDILGNTQRLDNVHTFAYSIPELDVNLTKPSFGWTKDESFPLEIQVTRPALECKYDNNVRLLSIDDLHYDFIGGPFDYHSQNLINFTTFGNELIVICRDVYNETITKKYDLVYDPEPVRILSAELNPNPISQYRHLDGYSNPVLFTQLNVLTDKPALCRFGLYNLTYDNMPFYVDGTGVEHSKYIVDGSQFNFNVDNTTDIIVTCKSLADVENVNRYEVVLSFDFRENLSITDVNPPEAFIDNPRNFEFSLRTNLYSRCYMSQNANQIENVFDSDESTSNIVHETKFPYNYNKEGNYSIFIYCVNDNDAEDVAGLSYGIHYDRTPPEITNVSLPPSLCSKYSVNVFLDILERISIVTNHQYQLYQKPNFRIIDWVNGTNPYTITGDDAGADLNLSEGEKYFVVARVKNNAVDKWSREKKSMSVLLDSFSEYCKALACGDGVCSSELESCATCPEDCGQCDPACNNTVFDIGLETDVDCGNDCPKCDLNMKCNKNLDCMSGFCADLNGNGTKVCEPSPCDNDEWDEEYETDKNCGGICMPCMEGQKCKEDSDCSGTLYCSSEGICTQPTCDDEIMNGDETGVDCGGSCTYEGKLCKAGEGCETDDDCETAYCVLQSGAEFANETGICREPSCDDGVQNQDETDVDCGGKCAGLGKKCGYMKKCQTDQDCSTGTCSFDSPECGDDSCTFEYGHCDYIQDNVNGSDESCYTDDDCNKEGCEGKCQYGTCKYDNYIREGCNDGECGDGEICKLVSKSYCHNTYECTEYGYEIVKTSCENDDDCNKDGCTGGRCMNNECVYSNYIKTGCSSTAECKGGEECVEGPINGCHMEMVCSPTDKKLVDTDGDGMPDWWEKKYLLDPNDPSDASKDPDKDGLTNLEEYKDGTNPMVVEDTDGDGMPDWWEKKYKLNPNVNDAKKDKDGDGLSNYMEYKKKTNPLKKDTDGDGYDDMSEIREGTDPLDPRSHPTSILIYLIPLILILLIIGGYFGLLYYYRYNRKPLPAWMKTVQGYLMQGEDAVIDGINYVGNSVYKAMGKPPHNLIKKPVRKAPPAMRAPMQRPMQRRPMQRRSMQRKPLPKKQMQAPQKYEKKTPKKPIKQVEKTKDEEWVEISKDGKIKKEKYINLKDKDEFDKLKEIVDDKNGLKKESNDEFDKLKEIINDKKVDLKKESNDEFDKLKEIMNEDIEDEKKE